MSVAATGWAWEQQIEPMGAKMVLLALADFADERGYCWPGQATLADMTGQSERAVRGHLKALAEAGFIRRGDPPADSGRNPPAAYYLCAPPERLGYRPMRKTRGSGAAETSAPRPADSAGRQPDDRKHGSGRDGGDDRKPDSGRGDDDRQISAPRPADFDTTTGKSPMDSKEESISDPSGTNTHTARARDDGFEAFWSAYLHPDGDPREEACREWDAAMAAGADPAWIVSAARAYRAERLSKPNSWIKHAATWLRERCWRDWPKPDGPKVSVQAAPEPEPIELRTSMVAPGISDEDNRRWAEARRALRVKIGGAPFAAWIAKLRLEAAGHGEYVIGAPTLFSADYVKANYERHLEAALSGRVRITVARSDQSGSRHEQASS